MLRPGWHACNCGNVTGVHFEKDRSLWFDDPQAKEIGDAASSPQFEFGWVYVRSKTGHRRERTKHRGRVS